MPDGSVEPSWIGPGRLVVVVGPSGAGKDTLLRLARDDFGGNASVLFPRRVVTRAPSPAEDNEFISEAAFAAAAAAGRFAFCWEAHGLKYAFGAAINDHIRAGKIVICNVSRSVIAQLRRRYANLYVVLVTAPPDALAARLAARGRAADGTIEARLGRAAPALGDLAPDLVIENVGDPKAGAAQLTAAIGGCRV
jgi:ribose 1,5-bisphosphokinase